MDGPRGSLSRCLGSWLPGDPQAQSFSSNAHQAQSNSPARRAKADVELCLESISSRMGQNYEGKMIQHA